ncbi:hypothetical protein TrVE_jg1371 [Triparma verrucosa]|uniref:Uncharacterized protein n=1 Tax=Triparma verrucosa TaxID=1606542 RepID=A0A9W6ZDI6_9STRA|nr:hypothetical protein TrVE_jg1371 [Triparma verrucosa]
MQAYPNPPTAGSVQMTALPTGGAPPRSASLQIAVPEPQTWMGIPMQNEKKARLVKIVMVLAAIGALGELVQFLVALTNDNQVSSSVQLILNLFIALSIPYCGWRGAKDDDQSMLCWFCGCNFAEACYTVMIVIYIHQHISYWTDVCEMCEDSVDFDFDNEADMNDQLLYLTVHECLADESRNSNIDPEYCTSENFRRLHNLLTEVEAVQIPLALMNLVMFYYGNKLYRIHDSTHPDIIPTQTINNRNRPDMPQLIEAQVSFSENRPQMGSNGVGNSFPPEKDPYATYAAIPFAGEARSTNGLGSVDFDNESRGNAAIFTTAAVQPGYGNSTYALTPASNTQLQSRNL